LNRNGKGRGNASNSDDQVLTPSELYDKKRRRTGSTVDRVEPLLTSSLNKTLPAVADSGAQQQTSRPPLLLLLDPKPPPLAAAASR